MTLGIIFLTYQRTGYAQRTIKTTINNLRYDGRILWYMADDGSGGDHVDRLVHTIRNNGGNLLAWHDAVPTGKGYGRNANVAWERLSHETAVTLWLEDDWELSQPLDVTPYVRLLEENGDVGMVRLGHMPINLDLRSVGYDGRMYLHVRKSQQYAYSGNPHLKHVRFNEVYGGLPTGMNPGETEVAYDHHVRFTAGPQIWWPLAIGDRFIWSHIGAEQSY